MSDYDVIIIGTGAGGGTLARHLAPSGKRVLLLERGDWLPREPENWDTAEVFVDGRYISADTWYDAKGNAFQPQIHYFVGGATKLYGAALYRLRERDFEEFAHHDGISPAWPIRYEDLEPYYTAAEQMYEVRGARGEDPTEPPASGPYPFPALEHEPRIQQLADDFAAAGYHPFHAPAGVRLNESNMAYSVCVRCGAATGSRVRCTRIRCRSVRGAARARARQRDAVARRPRGEAGDRCLRRDRHRGRRRARRRDRDGDRGYRRRGVRRGELGEAAARLGERRTPERVGERLRPGGAQLHVPQQPGGSGAVEGAQPDAVPEDARPERLLLRLGGLRLPDGQHPDDRQVTGGDVQGREADRDEARTDVLAARGGRARGRLLALDRGPALARQPRHAGARRERQADLPDLEPRGRQAPLSRAEVEARPARHERGAPHLPAAVHEDRHPDRGGGAPGRARVGSATIRQRRCSIRTARPTSSTTSMSSTRASSRASAP